MLRDFAKVLGYLLIVASSVMLCTVVGLEFRQIISVTVFTSFIAGSLFYWPFRNAFALAGVALLLGLRVLDVEHLIEFANLDIILFLVGMMIVVGYLEEKRFFDWLIGVLTKPFCSRPTALIAILLMLAAVMAALVDEVTSILFMMAIMLRVLKAFGVDKSKVLPFIIFLVFTTNIGSSALPVGNPIGVMVAFRAGLTTLDFVRWVSPLAVINAAVVTLIGLPYLKKTGFSKVKVASCADLRIEEVKFTRGMLLPLMVFIAVLCGLIMHHNIEKALHLPKSTMLLATPLLGAGAALTLKYTGVTDLIAQGVLRIIGGNVFYAMLLIGGISGILTAFMDNVLAIATMIPVVQSMAEAGVYVYPIWWIMLIGGTYCGNATVIGSTANIVAAGFVEKRGYGSFSMLKWILLGTPISIVTFLLALAMLYLQIPAMPR